MALTNTPPTNPYQFYGWYEFVRIGVRPPIPLLVIKRTAKLYRKLANFSFRTFRFVLSFLFR